ncbi:hypothetical protein IAE22_33505, partial [Bacillus sp. S34]|nr:hypothetical protein [Bacillus sp. S34]
KPKALRQLLHGVQAKSTEVVDDAVAMMHRLVDAVQTPSAAGVPDAIRFEFSGHRPEDAVRDLAGVYGGDVAGAASTSSDG